MKPNFRIKDRHDYSCRAFSFCGLCIFMLLALILTLTACTFDKGSDGHEGEGPGTNGPQITDPVYQGFSFSLGEGTYWEYAWIVADTIFSQGSGNSGSTETGRFMVALGASISVGDITMYEVTITGDSTDKDNNTLAPRWKWIGMGQNRLVGSMDGVSLTTIFDAQTGQWKGGGFFVELSVDEANTVTEYDLANEYISTQTLAVTKSSADGEGFYIGESYIPPSDEISFVSIADCFKPGIGPVGYSYRSGFSSNGGGVYTAGTLCRDIGLIGTNLSAPDGFVPVQPLWSTKAPMKNPRTVFAAGVINGRIYVAGGGSDTLEVYDPESDRWSEMSGPGSGISSGAAYDGKLYCIGHFTNLGYDVMYRYDPSGDEWGIMLEIRDADFFNERMVAAEDGLYIINGSGDPYNEVWRYDPVKIVWERIETVNPAYQLRTSAASDGLYMYSFGGYRESDGFLGLIRRMRFDTGEWEYYESMNMARYGVGATYDNGMIFIAGGYNDNGMSRAFERLNVLNETVETLEGMPTARENSSVVSLGGKIYVIGGNQDGDTILTTVECYDF